MSSTASATPQPPAGGPPTPPAGAGSGVKIVLWIVGGFVGFGVLCMIGVSVLVYVAAHKVKTFADNPGFAVAKFAIANNPDVEMLSSNDSAGTMVVRDKKTNQVLTMKFDPAKKSMTVTDEHGKTATISVDALHNGIQINGPDGKTASITADAEHNKLQLTGPDGKTASITADAQNGTVQMTSPDGTVKVGLNADKPPSWVPTYPGTNPQSILSASNANEQSGTSGFVTQDPVDKVVSYYSSALKSGGMTISTTTTNSNGKVGGIVSGEDSGRKHTVMVTAAGDTDGTHVSVSFSAKP